MRCRQLQIYVTVKGLNADLPVSVPGHVFRSTNSGSNWQDISAGLPDVPANEVAVHLTDPNTIFVATDMGVYKGTVSGGSWSWCLYMNGFPQTALVSDLTAHAESGLLRAFTYGRSAWEVQAFPIPDPDVKVDNDISNPPITGVFANSARISTGTATGTGRYYAVAWLDDRANLSEWHVYHKGFDSFQHPPSAVAGELRVDTTANAHIAGAPSLSAHPTQTTTPYCSRLAWHDDRLNVGVNQHVYTQYFCTDGYKIFTNDLRVDQHLTSINATEPVITFQPSLDFAVAWKADRNDGTGKHNIWARFFSVFGIAKGNEFQVDASTRDTSTPAIVSDSGSNVFIAWREHVPDLNGARKLRIAKYNGNGGLLVAPLQVNTGDDSTVRHDVQLSVDSLNRVLVTWSESAPDASLPGAIYMRRFDNSLGPVDVTQVKVNQPPSAPPSADRLALRPAIAADQTDVVIAWEANTNDATSFTRNAFARSFDSTGATKKNDFRVDLVPRSATLRSPGVARTLTAKRFAYVWEDNRAGSVRYDVYTRVGQAFP